MDFWEEIETQAVVPSGWQVQQGKGRDGIFQPCLSERQVSGVYE
jgi:hypothetical protein